MHETLRLYLKRLTNLTANNRSLVLLRLTKGHFIDICAFNAQMKEGAFGIIDAMIKGRGIALCSQLDSRDETSNIIANRLKKIARNEKFIYDEQGTKDLYIGWPFVKGKLSNGHLVRCPLLYFPVELKASSNQWRLQPRPNEEAFLNKNFLLAYAHHNNVKIDDQLIDRTLEDFDKDSTTFRTALYQLFKESEVELNFNRDNFEDRLAPFAEYHKADFDEKYGTGQLKLFPEAVLGIFPQSGSYLVPDYHQLLSQEILPDMEGLLQPYPATEGAHDTGSGKWAFDFSGQMEEEKICAPFKIDAYQESALIALKQGKSIVVQGPPGTGKSQLICNLIADQLASGKKVLVVSQKRAALDVVYQRMQQKDMAPFLGLIHDFKNDRKALFEKIKYQIDSVEEYRMYNNGLDAIQLERRFLQTSRRIDQITEKLEEFKYALFDESECGLSVKELYLTSDQEAPSVNLMQIYARFHFDRLSPFLFTLRNYAEYLYRLETYNHPWFNRRSFDGYNLSDRQRIDKLLDEIPECQHRIIRQVGDILGEKLMLKDVEVIAKQQDRLEDMLHILEDEKRFAYFKHLAGFADDSTSILWLSNTERILLDCFGGDGAEISLPAAQLGKFQEMLNRNMAARNNLFKLIGWKLFAKNKLWVKHVFAANGLELKNEGFQKMVRRIDNRLNLEHNLTKLKSTPWVTGVPVTCRPHSISRWFHDYKLAVKAKLTFNSMRGFKQYFNIKTISFEKISAKIRLLLEISNEISERKRNWLTYLTENQLNAIENNPQTAPAMKEVLKKDFEALCEFDELKKASDPDEIAAIKMLVAHTETPEPGQLEAIFQNSIRLAWIGHIENKYPILRSVSSKKLHRLEAELQALIKEKAAITKDMLLLRVREKTYTFVKHNRLNNMVTYRDLYHQVTKKRRIWPLRKLIAGHHDELFDLIPCWLASPEAVSAIFPMIKLFDLVIFDEASQCFAERGLPAIYRGRKTLIAGDSRQLRPNDLYRPRFDDGADSPDLETESLLELAGRYLYTVQLNLHYRSNSIDLIDFSNRHFYDGKLKMLPRREAVNSGKPGIIYIKVDGVRKNNINAKEADEVVRILIERVKSDDGTDVGVVTFNARQQQHILDRIDEEFIKAGLDWPDGWFVKNIENVQGDEKDLIIFSTAYAPDESGKIHLQFGSLNTLNGENRINVAISRAKQQVIVVSSIWPSQLHVENTKNAGPKLLKKYLHYAREVSAGTFIPVLPRLRRHHANWYLKTQLMNWAREQFEEMEFNRELPYVDITVKKKDKYVALLVTDDDLYFRSPSTKDAHVYTPYALTKNGWPFKSIFSREWWANKEEVKKELFRFLSQD